MTISNLQARLIHACGDTSCELKIQFAHAKWWVEFNGRGGVGPFVGRGETLDDAMVDLFTTMPIGMVL